MGCLPASSAVAAAAIVLLVWGLGCVPCALCRPWWLLAAACCIVLHCAALCTPLWLDHQAQKHMRLTSAQVQQSASTGMFTHVMHGMQKVQATSQCSAAALEHARCMETTTRHKPLPASNELIFKNHHHSCTTQSPHICAVHIHAYAAHAADSYWAARPSSTVQPPTVLAALSQSLEPSAGYSTLLHAPALAPHCEQR